MRGEAAEGSRADALRNRTAILDAALNVLAVAPSASLAEVAHRAGLGRATLYRHFENREALRDAIREEALARAAGALSEAGIHESPSVREGVRTAAAVLVPLGVRFRILLAEGADADPEFLAARDRVLEPVSALVLRGIADGELRSTVHPGWAGMVLAGLLVTAVRAVDADVLDVEEAADQVADTLFQGLGG